MDAKIVVIKEVIEKFKSVRFEGAWGASIDVFPKDNPPKKGQVWVIITNNFGNIHDILFVSEKEV